ncbi:hypothetical protein JQ631_28785 [Bradyrhizobium manausense]|jgi:hypothetical protein|nr:hypothetical protein [Bradyrhizobium manausense]MBR0793089.1 hypothetical protein [Bradyrhizobium manausense]
MRKVLAELDDEERYHLLYLADLGTALCMSGLTVSILHAVGRVLYS